MVATQLLVHLLPLWAEVVALEPLTIPPVLTVVRVAVVTVSAQVNRAELELPVREIMVGQAPQPQVVAVVAQELLEEML